MFANFSLWDLSILGLYFAVVLWIAWWASKGGGSNHILFTERFALNQAAERI